MRKIKLLFAAVLSMIASTGVMAQTTAEIDAANAAITDNGVYRIYTQFNGSSTGTTKYYLKTDGYLTDNKDEAGLFTFALAAGGSYAPGKGYKLNQFTNGGDGSNNITNDAKKHIIVSSNNNRDDFEGQVFFLNAEGNYAIRSTNANSTGWAAAAFWTVTAPIAEASLPNATYTMNGTPYIWQVDGPLTTVNVTYKLVESDGTTLVSSTTVKQEANSALLSPLPGTGVDYNGFFHEKFYYDYAVSGTIGDTDCTITITRTEKAGLVKALTDLSNNKAYNIGCDRGAMIAYNNKMVNTALNDATANAQPLGKFALINYEDNYYIFSIDENKFVKNDASVALDLTAVGFSTEDAIVMEAKDAPYFLWHFNAKNKYLNTNGNASLGLGYVINDYSTPDPGNLYYMVAVDDFDPTAALAELEAYFHPSYFVTYVVKDELGNTIFTSEPQPTKLGATITTLLDEFKRPFYTYNDTVVTISENETTVEFIATWTGPFEISTDFATAHWYDMAMRRTWYVTSAAKDANDGDAYVTQNANTMGLVEDSYQWAFIGDGYNGFKIINKAEGDGKSFGWTDAQQTNAGIPTVMGDSEGHHAWNIVPSTNGSVPAGSFCLNVPGTALYINQYGGAGGKVKFWNSTNNIGDEGSAFTVFDVPTNFASYLVEDGIDAEFEATGYFTFTDEAKAALGWDPAYKTDCPFDIYKRLKENLPAAKNDLANFVLPETGYYLLKNKNYGTYMGIDPSDANMYGNYDAIKGAKNIVTLTKNADNTYTIGLMGKFAPATVTKSGQVTATADTANYTVVIPAMGYVAFQANPAEGSEGFSALHCDGAGKIVGWETAAAASQWEVIDAEGTEISIEVSAAGYATTYMPFPVAIPEGVTVYTAKITDGAEGTTPGDYKFLTLNELTNGTIPALTAVILKAKPAPYKFAVGEGAPKGALKVYEDEVDGSEALARAFAEAVENNDLKGTLEPIDAAGKYVLAQPENEPVCFYLADKGNIAAGKAYLELPAPAEVEIKGFYFLFQGEDATGISTIDNGQLTIDNAAIFNIAGQKLSKMQKGINIVNGKKVLK